MLVNTPNTVSMTARELKVNILGKRKSNKFHIIGFTKDWKHWWNVHSDEEVPDEWMLKLIPGF